MNNGNNGRTITINKVSKQADVLASRKKISPVAKQIYVAGIIKDNDLSLFFINLFYNTLTMR